MDKKERIVIAIDCETDPFERGQIVEPFVFGAFDGEVYDYHWSDDPDECAIWMLNYAQAWGDDAIFYAHNGGKFDFHFLFKHATEIADIIMIGSRIVQMRMNGALFRDSYAMIPAPLSAYNKTVFDYNKMKRPVRNKNRVEIISYLKDDCVDLHTLVTAFIERFGLHLTMAGAALKQLSDIHPYKKMTGDNDDALFRQFYYGGRVQYFQQGIIKGDWKIYDVNSMYPSVMKDELHPITNEYITHSGDIASHPNVIKNADFIEVDCYARGCFPWRTIIDKQHKLLFPHARNTYFVSGHEFRMATKLGLIDVHEIKKAYIFEEKASFAEFIEKFYGLRLKAKEDEQALYVLFYKLVMNSSYGKFAQDPTKFKEFAFSRDEILPAEDGWSIEWQCPETLKRIYSRPSQQPLFRGRHNVAIAASITGAARSVLMEGLHNAVNPVYCDTDSIICEGLKNVPLHPSKLGAWDLEKTGDLMAIVGRKTYTLKHGADYVKIASKGVRATGPELERIANGEIILFENEAPTFSLGKEQSFIKRNVRIT